MNNQNFKVFGEDDLLKNIKINIVETSETGEKKQRTLLFQGEKYEVEAETEVGVIYEMYVSYKDSFTNVLTFENIMKNANDHINYLYLKQENDVISVQYIGREAGITNKQGPSIILLPKEDFFKSKGITIEKDKEKYNDLFFNNIR